MLYLQAFIWLLLCKAIYSSKCYCEIIPCLMGSLLWKLPEHNDKRQCLNFTTGPSRQEDELEEAALAEKIVPRSTWQTPTRTIVKAVHCGWADGIAVTVA